MKLIKFQIGILSILLSIDLSIQQGLFGVNLNLDPVISALTPNKNPVQSTTSAAIVTNRFQQKPPSGPSCGRRKIHHTGLITGGQPTKPGDWPWHVAIYRMKSSSSEQKYVCGGSLLTTSRVLTAGHCVVENGAVIVPERLFVFLGKYNLAGGDMGPQEKGVFQIILHPDFSHTTLKNDIAILKLSSAAKYTEYVQPVCLWNKNDVDRENIMKKDGTVVGWGFTQVDAISNELMKAVMPVVPDLKCLKRNSAFYSNFLTEFTYCAGFANGTSTCNGDSGGGMFFSQTGNDGVETWYVRGIVSLGVSRADKNICDPNQYTIFTDSAQYLDFIQENLNVE